MQGESQAIQRNPPGGNVATTQPNAFANNNVLALSAGVSSSAQALPTGNGYFMTFVAIGTVEVHLRFGNSSVAASTASDYCIPPNGKEEWWITTETNFTAFCTAAATLYYYRSSP